MIKFFKTPESFFSTSMGLDFCIFLATCKNLFQAKLFIARQLRREMTRQTKKTFRRTTTLQACAINQVDNNCF